MVAKTAQPSSDEMSQKQMEARLLQQTLMGIARMTRMKSDC
jgi:hypothetical protein